MVNRDTAKKPLMMSRAVCCRLARPLAYSMPHSKARTTRLTANSAHASRLKNRMTTWTHSKSNSSTPMLPIWAKKLPKNPTSWP